MSEVTVAEVVSRDVLGDLSGAVSAYVEEVMRLGLGLGHCSRRQYPLPVFVSDRRALLLVPQDNAIEKAGCQLSINLLVESYGRQDEQAWSLVNPCRLMQGAKGSCSP